MPSSARLALNMTMLYSCAVSNISGMLVLLVGVEEAHSPDSSQHGIVSLKLPNAPPISLPSFIDPDVSHELTFQARLHYSSGAFGATLPLLVISDNRPWTVVH